MIMSIFSDTYCSSSDSFSISYLAHYFWISIALFDAMVSALYVVLCDNSDFICACFVAESIDVFELKWDSDYYYYYYYYYSLLSKLGDKLE